MTAISLALLPSRVCQMASSSVPHPVTPPSVASSSAWASRSACSLEYWGAGGRGAGSGWKAGPYELTGVSKPS